MCEKFFLWSFLHSYIFFNFFVIHAHPVQKEIADVIPLEITWFSFIWLTLFLSLDANTYTKLNLYIFQETWTIVQSYSIHYDMLIFHHQNLSFILKNFKFDSKRELISNMFAMIAYPYSQPGNKSKHIWKQKHIFLIKLLRT